MVEVGKAVGRLKKLLHEILSWRIIDIILNRKITKNMEMTFRILPATKAAISRYQCLITITLFDFNYIFLRSLFLHADLLITFVDGERKREFSYTHNRHTVLYFRHCINILYADTSI